MELNKEKIAVIGGAGFIGSRLSARLDISNLDYVICDINTAYATGKVIYLDVEDASSIDQLKGVSAIINLAAIHRDDVRPLSRYDDVNVQGAVNVCNSARKQGI